MKKRKKKPLPVRSKSPLRNKRIVFNLNETEFDALTVYCKRYKIANRSMFLRKTILGKVSQKFIEDYPTLF